MDAVLIVKATVLLSIALGIAQAIRRSSAIVRHGLWTMVFASMLALPWLGVTLPVLDVPVPQGWGSPVPRADRVGSGTRAVDRVLPAAGVTENGVHAPSAFSSLPAVDAPVPFDARRAARTVLLASWIVGTALALSALCVSLVRVRRLAFRSVDLDDDAWQEAAAEIGERLGLRTKARLVIAPGISAAMAGGILRPTIFLPDDALGWSAEQRDIVLAHEMAHVSHRDPLRHVLARLALALYWFHPLAWLVARESAAAREHACDETVLSLGTRRSAYARVLLEFAESVRPSPLLAALPIVHPSLLESRVMAILHDVRRPVPRRIFVIPALLVSMLTLTLAAARPSPAPGAPPTGDARVSAGVTATAATVFESPTDRSSATAIDRAAPAGAQVAGGNPDSACASDLSSAGSFSGSISTSNVGGRTVIHEQVGTRGYDRVIRKTFGDLQLCLVAEDAGDADRAGLPSEWVGRARRLVIETRRGTAVQRMELGRAAGGGAPIAWQVGGANRPVDEAALRWRAQALAALDSVWELSSLRGQVSSLHGEISSIYGERSSLQGEISSLMGEVSSMRGRISSVQGEESSLRGEISAIQGQVSSLRGAISSERGAISSLNGSRYDLSDADRRRLSDQIARHDAEIERIEREIRDFNADTRIRDVERRMTALNADGQVAAIERQIREFNLNTKVAEIERRIRTLDVDTKVQTLEREIRTLDDRLRRLDQPLDGRLKELDAAITAIR